MATFALIFEPKSGKQKDLYSLLSDCITGDLYFAKHLAPSVSRIREVGGAVWFIMRDLTSTLLTISEMPEWARKELKSYHIVRYTDLAEEKLEK